jgi:hypothetical protein
MKGEAPVGAGASTRRVLGDGGCEVPGRCRRNTALVGMFRKMKGRPLTAGGRRDATLHQRACTVIPAHGEESLVPRRLAQELRNWGVGVLDCRGRGLLGLNSLGLCDPFVRAPAEAELRVP